MINITDERIRLIATHFGLSFWDAYELMRREPEMIRAVLEECEG